MGADIVQNAGPTYCFTCVCSIGQSILVGFEKAGVKINGVPIVANTNATVDGVSPVSTLMTSCSSIIGFQLISQGNLTSDALTALADSCDIQATSDACAAELGQQRSVRSTAGENSDALSSNTSATNATASSVTGGGAKNSATAVSHYPYSVMILAVVMSLLGSTV